LSFQLQCDNCERKWPPIHPVPYCPFCGSYDVREVDRRPEQRPEDTLRGPILGPPIDDIPEWEDENYVEETGS